MRQKIEKKQSRNYNSIDMEDRGMTDGQMRAKFIKLYGDGGDIRAYFAPGRVNLIGEHIDYNGGHVFPCALTVGTYCYARRREDKTIRFFSQNFSKGGVFTSSVENLTYKKEDRWTNYPKGVFWAIQERGYEIPCGFDIFVYGNIPGSGLSSSASMEVVIGTMLNDMLNLGLSMQDIAVIGQYSENKFNSMNCGIMDQFASAMGSKDKAIFLDCHTLAYEYIPIELKGCKIIVTNSNKPHSLVSSHYNERRESCEKALEEMKAYRADLQNLCQLSIEEFEANKDLIRDDFRRKNAKHAVYEEQRTKDAIVALKNADLVNFGRLLNESGDSLRYDYDATCFEIDVLVDGAREQEGVYGSRETGGGWGGNIISIVKDENIDAFIENLGKIYKEKTGLTADFYVLEIGDGGRRIL